MQFIAIALIIFLFSAWALIRLTRNKTKSHLTIQPRSVFLDKQLREFKKRLVEAFKEDFDIYAHVHLADLLSFKFKSDDKVSESIQQKITSISIDFVLVEQLSGRVSCLVQMDQEQEKTEQYTLTASSCQQAKLPLIHFPKDTDLNATQIKKQIMSFLEPTINLEDESDYSDIKVYLEPVSKESGKHHEVVHETN